mmetsp:Transcript_2938/g.430  ORF Transcript_2938/g.430 Transcript_2938/m.430 type:complete len:94 (+) Transcript_2938:219-500(+)
MHIGKARKERKKLAVFFTDKTNLPKSLKILISKFGDFYRFATVNSGNKKMVEKFGVKKFPAVIVLNYPDNINSGVEYEGEYKKTCHCRIFRIV